MRAGLTQHTVPLMNELTEVEMFKQKSVLNPFIIKLVINLKEFLKLTSYLLSLHSTLNCRVDSGQSWPPKESSSCLVCSSQWKLGLRCVTASETELQWKRTVFLY